MESTDKSTAKYWLYFLVALVIMIVTFIFQPAWFWVPLPFVLTYLVMAFRAM